MSIRYITTGNEFVARGLLGEGRHQLSILKNDMTFQKLQQLQRIVRFDDGTVIKCLSCFGQDVVSIYVPPIGRKEEILRKIPLSKYYPAFEAYDGILWNSKFMGVVLCKGGGFEPPYEFIEKDSLPNDYPDEPLGKLPKERIWWPEVDRRLQDIVPKGIAEADIVNKQATVVNESWPGGFGGGFLVKSCRYWYESPIYCDGAWWYYARAGALYQHSRTENLNVNPGFSYTIRGEAHPGYWPDYIYNDRSLWGGRKPDNLLNLNYNFYRTIEGSGNNKFFGCLYAEVNEYACKFVDGHWEPDPSITFETIEADAMAQTAPPSETYTFEKRTDFYRGAFKYSYLDSYREIWNGFGSVLDADHYALVFSGLNGKVGKAYSKIVNEYKNCLTLLCASPSGECLADPTVVETEVLTEGPLAVAIDGVVFELFPETQPENSPRLQWAYLKYFRVAERSIGMFHIVKNYNYPLDYIYVYAEVQHKEGEPANPEIAQLVITEVEEHSTYHVIPGVTDSDGNILYGRGRFRLIYEEEGPIIEKGG